MIKAKQKPNKFKQLMASTIFVVTGFSLSAQIEGSLNGLLISSVSASPAVDMSSIKPLEISCEPFSPQELDNAAKTLETFGLEQLVSVYGDITKLLAINPNDASRPPKVLDAIAKAYKGKLDPQGNLMLRKAVLRYGIASYTFTPPRTKFNLDEFNKLNGGDSGYFHYSLWLPKIADDNFSDDFYTQMILGEGTLSECQGEPNCAWKFDENSGSEADMIDFVKYLKSIDLAKCAAPAQPAVDPKPAGTCEQTPPAEGKMCFCKDNASAACKWRKKAAP